MNEDQVLVPPEVRDGLDALLHAGELHPQDRTATIQTAREHELDATVKWLRKVDDDVYENAARGEFTAGDESE